MAIVDSAIQLFPTDAMLLSSKQVIMNSLVPVSKETKSLSVDPALAQQYLSITLIALNKGDYALAATNFTKLSSVSPVEYLILENTGICYFNMKEYKKAIGWFTKAIQLKTAKDGKSEFFKGKCLYQNEL